MTLSYALKRYGVPVLILGLAVLVFMILSGMKEGQKRGKPRAFVRRTQTRNVTYGQVRPVIRSSGRVNAWEKVSLTPEVSGLVLAKDFALREGMAFTKGQVLYRIDSRQAEYALRGTISDLQNALSSLLPELKVDIPEVHGTWQTFFNDLSAENIPDIPAYTSQREKLLATRYQVYKLYYQARTQALILEKHTVRAPFSGTVEQSSVYPSSMARTGSPVATITRTDQVEIELALSVPEARLVRPGHRARITADDIDGAVSGTVHRKSNVLDERMQTVPVFIRVTGSAARRLASGAYAEVELTGRALEYAFSLPRKAIHGRDRVYTVEDGRLAEHRAEIGFTGIGEVYIIGGVEEGAVVVTEPLQDAVIGMAVMSGNGKEQKIRSTGKGKGGAR